MMTPDQFAQAIKTKYPQYSSLDNATLTQKMLAKYPQYQSQVQIAPAAPTTPTPQAPTLGSPPTSGGLLGAAKTVGNLALGGIKPEAKASLDLGIGAVKGLGSTISGMESLGEKYLTRPIDKAVSSITGKPSPLPVTGPTAGENLSSQYLQPKNTAQKIGRFLEQTAEFLAVPGEAEAAKAAEMAPKVNLLEKAATKAPNIASKVAGLTTRMGKEALTMATVGAVQKGNLDHLKSDAILGAAFPLLGFGVSKALPLASGPLESLSNKITNVVLKPTKGDLENVFSKPGEDAASTFAKNVRKYDVGGTLKDTLSKTNAKLNDLWGKLKDKLGSVSLPVDLNSTYDKTMATVEKEAAKQFGDTEAIKRVSGKLLQEIDNATKGNLVTDLLTAQDIKHGAGTKGAWVFGSADPDASATEYIYTKFYQQLRKDIEDVAAKSGVPDIAAINKQMSDLIPIKSAAIRRLPVASRNEIGGLINNLHMLGAVFNPKALGLMGINELLKSGRFAEVLGKAADNFEQMGSKTRTGISGRFMGQPGEKVGPIGMGIEDVSGGKPPVVPKAPTSAEGGYQGSEGLTLKTLEKLKGKTTVSKQFISDLTNSGDLKQAERDIIRKALAEEGDKVDAKKFAGKVQTELLPLERRSVSVNDKSPILGTTYQDNTRYENITLPEEVRGNVKDYSEHVYNSPIKTSAGSIHFDNSRLTATMHGGKNQGIADNYFAHSRLEDMADGKTRRVIEVQSDLFQKGRLENERGMSPEQAKYVGDKAKALGDTSEPMSKRYQETAKLEPYRNTWHERVIKEELKQAAKDGKSTVLFPTGETAIKVEGLGQPDVWWNVEAAGKKLIPEDLEVGQLIGRDRLSAGDDWIITDVLGDGKFKAVPKEDLRLSTENVRAAFPDHTGKVELNGKTWLYKPSSSEAFDISGSVDKENPIYKFYQKDVQKYLKNKYGATPFTDDKGVTWWKVDVKPEMKKAPIEAFAALPVAAAAKAKIGAPPTKNKQ